MHANKREEIKEVYAGDIAAAVGLRSVTTGDTHLRREEADPARVDGLPRAGHLARDRAEDQGRPGKARPGHGKLMAEDPTFRVKTDEQTGQVVIAGMGELHLEIIVDRLKREFNVEASVGKPQVAYKETLTRPAEGEMTVRQQTGGRGQYGHAKIHLIPLPAGHRLRVRERDRRRLDPEGIHQADRRRAFRKRSRAACSPATRSTTCGSSCTTGRTTTSTRRKWRSRLPGRWRSRTRRRRPSRCCSSR